MGISLRVITLTWTQVSYILCVCVCLSLYICLLSAVCFVLKLNFYLPLLCLQLHSHQLIIEYRHNLSGVVLSMPILVSIVPMSLKRSFVFLPSFDWEETVCMSRDRFNGSKRLFYLVLP